MGDDSTHSIAIARIAFRIIAGTLTASSRAPQGTASRVFG
jgi:hypothetical protein